MLGVAGLGAAFACGSDALLPSSPGDVGPTLGTVADVLRNYHRQPEYKFFGGGWNEEGVLRRQHILVDTIEDIGKESDGWEEDEARTEGQDTVLTYPSVGKRQVMREARIAMRKIDAVWDGTEVADGDLKRMAGAAERIVDLKEKRKNERAAAVAWLKAKRNEIGLAALASMLEVDAANLGKIIEGRRNPPKTLAIRLERK